MTYIVDDEVARRRRERERAQAKSQDALLINKTGSELKVQYMRIVKRVQAHESTLLTHLHLASWAICNTATLRKASQAAGQRARERFDRKSTEVTG